MCQWARRAFPVRGPPLLLARPPGELILLDHGLNVNVINRATVRGIVGPVVSAQIGVTTPAIVVALPRIGFTPSVIPRVILKLTIRRSVQAGVRHRRPSRLPRVPWRAVRR